MESIKCPHCHKTIVLREADPTQLDLLRTAHDGILEEVLDVEPSPVHAKDNYFRGVDE